MDTIIFTENGSALKVDIDYKGAVLASYTYRLWEADSNVFIDKREGNNLNSDDDRYELPDPVNDNNGRVIQVVSVLSNPTDDKLKCAPLIKVFQGTKKIGEVKDDRELNGMETQLNNIFIQLEMQ